MQCGDFRVSYASDERIFQTRLPIVGLVALLAALAFVPLFAGTYWLDVLNRIGIAIIGAVGLNILVGFTGQISIGHAAFLAVGAYSTAILGSKAGLPFWLTIPLAGALTSVFGLVFGVPSLRLKGLYLAMIIIGGMGSILGSIFGAAFMTLLPEVLKLSATSLTGVYPNAFGLIASARDIIFGLAIIFFLMYEPAGLARIWERFRSYWKLWPYAY